MNAAVKMLDKHRVTRRLPRLLLWAALWLGCLAAPLAVRADDTPAYSVNFYLAMPEDWLDKEIILQVSHIRVSPNPVNAEGMLTIEVHTAWGYDFGGKMLALLPQADLKTALTRYGGELTRIKDARNTPYYKTAPMSGILKKADDGRFFLYIPKGTKQALLDATHPPPYAGK
jgi:hypothetical protein